MVAWSWQKHRSWLQGVIGIALLIFGPGLWQLAHLSLTEYQLDRRLARLARERQRLTDERQRLQHDPAYVEGLIRSTFKLAQPGEYVVPLDSSQSR